MKNRDETKELDGLRKELLLKEAAIAYQQAQLNRIHRMKSLRLLIVLTHIKRQAFICIRGFCRFFGLLFLFICTFLIAGYLYALKKIRNIIIFPGG